MSKHVREWSSKLLDAIDDGLLDPKTVVEMCVSYMSEADVEEMIEINELKSLFRCAYENEDEHDDFEEEY